LEIIKWNKFTAWITVRGLKTVVNLPEDLKTYLEDVSIES
jgi:hypothetical protein